MSIFKRNFKQMARDFALIEQNMLKRCENRCQMCAAKNGSRHLESGKKIKLKVYQKDARKANDFSDANLIVLCQICHWEPFRKK
jgi:hypothetical protein